MWIPCCLVLFVEKTILSPLNNLDTHTENHLATNVLFVLDHLAINVFFVNLCLVLDLKMKAFCLSPLNMMLTMGFFRNTLLRNFFLYS